MGADMAVKLPYLSTPGIIQKVLLKIQEARRPERFTQDFLETKLGYSGGSARATIPLLKRMGFLASDGTPTNLYDQFRNSTTQAVALAAGVRNAYSEIFDRNRYANDLTREKFSSLVTEMTGLEKDSQVGKLIVSTFWTLKDGADFDSDLGEAPAERSAPMEAPSMGITVNPAVSVPPPVRSADENFKLNIGYTINLNLPETTNPEVFNAIFKSLKENLLRD